MDGTGVGCSPAEGLEVDLPGTSQVIILDGGERDQIHRSTSIWPLLTR